MRWGIVADIHSNLEALDAVLDALAKEHIDRYLCLGDIVGYGADPAECITRIKRLNPVIIAGNHDWASARCFDLAYFSPQAKEAVLWTSRNLTSVDKGFLQGLELVYREEELTLVHGSLEHPEQFEYIVDIAAAQKTFKLLETRLLFIGHSHIPEIFIKEDGRCWFSYSATLNLKDSQSYIVNAGSVGQPRDGNPQAAYVVYDNKKAELHIKRVDYDLHQAQDKIMKAGLPPSLAERLMFGR